MKQNEFKHYKSFKLLNIEYKIIEILTLEK